MFADMARGVVVAGVTVAVIVAAVLVLGIVLLFRRRDGAQPTSASGIEQLTTTANVALVRADESLASAQDELGFAIAQFGEERTLEFATAVASASEDITAAFRIKQQLDDAYPESSQKRRELTLQVVALVGSAQKVLDSRESEFASLRSSEANAPAAIASLRTRIADATSRIPRTQEALAQLAAGFAPNLIASVSDAPAAAAEQLAAATAAAGAAEARVSPSGVNSVAAEVAASERALRGAIQRLDAVDAMARDLAASSAALERLSASTATDLAEAREARDAAPDPQTQAGIIAAIAGVERVVVDKRDPSASIDRLGAAVSALDTALASARNQASRLSHARTALEGALVSARSQIAVAQSAGGGADARTRLTEAKRQLMLAESESDPVEALDAARRAVTHARDAEALALYRSL